MDGGSGDLDEGECACEGRLLLLNVLRLVVKTQLNLNYT